MENGDVEVRRIAMVSLRRFILDEKEEEKRRKKNKKRVVHLFQGIDIDILEGHRHGTASGPIDRETNKDQMARFFEGIRLVKDALDCVIVYLEDLPETRSFLELAKECGLSPERVFFVLCPEEYQNKVNLIRELGYHPHKAIRCEYGGFKKMRELYYQFLASGDAPA